MNSRSRGSRLQCKNVTSKTEKEKVIKPQVESKKTPVLNTTPIAKRSLPKDDMEDEGHLSPFFMKFTQDSGDDEVDVVWDWDSPRSKGTNTRGLNRRRILHSSPNFPKIKTVQSSSLPRFNSLKAELEQFANQLNHQEDCQFDDDLFLKPATPPNAATPPNVQEIEDLFNDDSFNEEMIKCSQQVEEAYKLNQWCTSIITNNNINVCETIQDDSFDCFLEKIDDEDIERLSQENQVPVLQQTVSVPSPRSIMRTNSFPVEIICAQKSTLGPSTSFMRTKSAEIPDQRENNHRLRCSPEEIEKKRLEAKARLEFKRKHTEIEKKRLEALDRLKKNRMRRQNSKYL